MRQEAYFHQPSEAVRFWVLLDARWVGASIGRHVLHYSFCAGSSGDQPLETYLAHAPEIDAAVRRRLAAGSLEPVLLREHDLRPSTAT